MSYQARFLDRQSPPHAITLVALAALSALAMNLFLPSLPGMAAEFGTDYGVMQLSVSLYLGVNAALQLDLGGNAALQLVVGPLSDRFGRRPVILAGLVLFLLATLGCLLARDAATFLAFRMAQASIVAGMVLSRAVIRDVVPAEQAASMIGYVTMGMAFVPMVGPAIGGLLDEQFGWRANFWLLFGLGLLWLTHRDLGETARRQVSTMGEQLKAWPELLRSPRFWGHAATAAFASGAFFAYLGGAPWVGREVFGLRPAALGILFGAPALGYALGNFLSGRLAARVGILRMELWGAATTLAGLAISLLLSLAGASGPWTFFGLMNFVGIGNGLVLPSANAGMLSVRPHLAGSAAGLGGALMIGGGAGASAVAGWLLGPGADETPLVALMTASAFLSLVAAILVRRRERRLAVRG